MLRSGDGSGGGSGGSGADADVDADGATASQFPLAFRFYDLRLRHTYLIRFRPLKIPPPPHKQPRCLSRPALAPLGVLKLRIGFLCLQSARAPRLDVDDARFRERSLPCTPPLCPRNRGAPPERRRGSQLSRSSGFQVLQRCDVVVLRSVRGGMLVFMLPPQRWPARSARGSLLAVHRMPVMLFLPVSRVLCLRWAGLPGAGSSEAGARVGG